MSRCMPVLTLRLSDAEMQAADTAADKQSLNRSDFARRAIRAASEPEARTSRARGALKGRFTYRQAMQLLRG